jgi:hypothetical protein
MSSRSNGSKFFEKVRVGCFHTAARMVPRYILGPPCFGEVPEICGNLTSSNSLFRFGSLRTVAKPVTISNGVMLQLKRCDFAALDCPKKLRAKQVLFFEWPFFVGKGCRLRTYRTNR